MTASRSQAGPINRPHFLDMSSGFRKTWIRVLVLALSSCVSLEKHLTSLSPCDMGLTI